MLVFASGCSNHVPYKNNLDKNLTVNTTTKAGSALTKLETWVEVYSVDQACNLDYKGTFDLKEKQELIGLPMSQLNYLYFAFWNKKFLGGSSSKIGVGVYLNTLPGYKYVADISYVDSFYDVILKEQKKGSKKSKELSYGECKPM